MELVDGVSSYRRAAERVEDVARDLHLAVAARRRGEHRDLEQGQRRLEDLVLDLSHALPAGTQDYEARVLFEHVLRLRRALEPAEPDLQEGLLVLIQLMGVLKRLERKLEHTRIEDPAEATQFVLDCLRGVPDGEVAELLGVSTRTLGNWRTGSVPRTQGADRLLLIAQVLMYLRPSMTPRGLALWFRSRNPGLDQLTPVQLLEKDLREAELRLRQVARGGRGQLAT